MQSHREWWCMELSARVEMQNSDRSFQHLVWTLDKQKQHCLSSLPEQLPRHHSIEDMECFQYHHLLGLTAHQPQWLLVPGWEESWLLHRHGPRHVQWPLVLQLGWEEGRLILMVVVVVVALVQEGIQVSSASMAYCVDRDFSSCNSQNASPCSFHSNQTDYGPCSKGID